MEVDTITREFVNVIIQLMKEEFNLDILDGPDRIEKIERVNDSDKPGIIERIWFSFEEEYYFAELWHNDGYADIRKL